MYLSDRDLRLALDVGLLIVNPPPAEIDTTSIDLHLDDLAEAKVWDVSAFEAEHQKSGHVPPALSAGGFNYKQFARKFARPIPPRIGAEAGAKVYRIDDQLILEPGGFFLWQTKEEVGTTEVDPRLICFVNGKSAWARIGLLVHVTAPTIHAGWWGKITLEIKNLGPFRLSLAEGDAVAQIVVATISSPPTKKKAARGIAVGQQNVGGGSPRKRKR